MSPPAKRVCVVGSANTDMVVKCPHLPAPGETVLGGRFVTVPGGKGANQAVAAARSGAAVTFVCCLGDDSLGDEALAHYRAEGIDVSRIRRVPNTPSGVALIFVDEEGENEIVVAPGANAALSPTDVDACEAVLADAAVLLTQLETPLPTVERALVVASRGGVHTVVDPAPACPLPAEILRLTDIITPNEHELGVLVQRELGTQEAEEAAARRLLEAGVRHVLVTLGERGALLATRDGITRFPAVQVEPVDTTAAGDAFAGALAASLAEGAVLADAIRFATVAAALSVTRLGAQPALAARDEIDRWLTAPSNV